MWIVGIIPRRFLLSYDPKQLTIEETARLQEQAKHSSRLEAILGNAVDAIVTINDRGIIESANPATERMFGYTLREMAGQNVKMLMPSPYCEEHDGYLRNYSEGGAPKIIGTGRVVEGRRKDGSTFPMHLAVSEFDDNGKRMFTGIVRDISDIKQAEQELQQLNSELEARVRRRTAELREAQAELLRKEKLATLGQVSGGIAHEIRNPLNAVKTSVYYLVHARNPTEEKIAEHLQRIDRQVTLIDHVVTALSDVAKLPEPNRSALAVEDMLRDIVRTTGMPPEIKVRWELPGTAPRVLADEYQLPIVFKNLIRNARDAMPSGGTMTVGVAALNDRVQISIADTGHGIAEHELEKVFEPLYSTKSRGMGLGLAITKTIVEKNGGELQIESRRGYGSKFTVILDAAD